MPCLSDCVYRYVGMYVVPVSRNLDDLDATFSMTEQINFIAYIVCRFLLPMYSSSFLNNVFQNYVL